jgi:hypothetical protein
MLVNTMIDDLATRIAIASDRVSKALQEMRNEQEELNARSSRFAKIA